MPRARAGQAHRRRAGREAALDELPGKAGAQAGPVDRGAGLLQKVDRRGRVVADADLLEHAHRLLVHELPLGLRQVCQRGLAPRLSLVVPLNVAVSAALRGSGAALTLSRSHRPARAPGRRGTAPQARSTAPSGPAPPHVARPTASMVARPPRRRAARPRASRGARGRARRPPRAASGRAPDAPRTCRAGTPAAARPRVREYCARAPARQVVPADADLEDVVHEARCSRRSGPRARSAAARRAGRCRARPWPGSRSARRRRPRWRSASRRRRGPRTRPVMPPSEPAWKFGALASAEMPGGLREQAVVLAHLEAGEVDEPDLRARGDVAAGAHVGDGRADARR